MILFLDFDGVLHPAVCRSSDELFVRLPLIEGMLRECPEVDVVITSTWREQKSFTKLREIFSPDISCRIVGTTPNWRDIQDATSMGRYVRQAEIEAWIRNANRSWEPWVAIDDQPWLFKPFQKNVLFCDPDEGLTTEICADLRQQFVLNK